MLGPIAAVAGVVVIGFKLASEAAKAFASAVNSRVEQLTAFSPDLARAQARNQVADVRANLRAGREFGADFAKFATTQGEMRRDLNRIGDTILTTLLNDLQPILEAISAGIKFLAENKAWIQEGTKRLEEAIVGGYSTSAAIALRTYHAVQSIDNKTEDANKSDQNFIHDWNELPDLALTDLATLGAGLKRKDIAIDAKGAEIP